MSDTVQRNARGAVRVGAAHLFLTLTGYFIAVLLARTLGPAEYGTYGLIYSLLMGTELLIQFGVPVAVSRMIAGNPQDDRLLVANGLGMVLVVYAIVFAAVWISAPFLAEAFHIPDGIRLLRIAVLDLPLYGAFLLLDNVLGGRRDFGAKSLALFAYGATKVVGLLLLIVLPGGISVAGALVVNIAASAVGLVFCVVQVRGVTVRLNSDVAKSILKLAGTIALMDAAIQLLLYVDVWCLSLMDGGVSPEIQGYYIAAKNMARIPTVISVVLNAVLIPSLSNAVATGSHSDVKKYIYGTMRFLAITLLPGCALISVEAEPVMTLMFSQTYADAGSYLAVLVIGNGLLYTVFSILLGVLIAIGRERAAAMVAVCSVVSAVASSVVLVQLQGADGAALGTVVSSLVNVVMAAIIVRRALGSLMQFSILPKVLLGTAAICVLAYWIDTEGLFLVIEMSVLMLLFLALCVPLRLLGKDDLAMLLKSRSAQSDTA